jgi:MFS family permease
MSILTNHHRAHTTQLPGPQPEAASFLRVLKNRNFLRLWIAQLISLTVLNAANFGLILLVQETTNSVILVSLVIIAFQLPAFPFGAVAGVIVDWLDKRLVLWVSNVLRMGTMLLMSISVITDRSNLWPLFVLLFITSLIGQFFMPAEGSSIPLLVGEQELMPALALFNITINIALVVGILLLGGVIATLLPPFTIQIGSFTRHIDAVDMLFVIAMALYGVCAILILSIPDQAFHEDHVDERKNPARMSINEAITDIWRDMVEGWNIVRADRQLYFSVIQLAVTGSILLLLGELAPSFVEHILHRPASQMAIILSPAGVGLVGASILMPRITARVGKVRLALIGVIVLAAGFALIPLSQWVAWLLDPVHGSQAPLLLGFSIILLFFIGVGMALVNIPAQTIMQERAPDAGRGRVLSLQFMLYNVGSIPVLLFAGVIAQFLGFNRFVLLVALCLLLFWAWGWWYIKKTSHATRPLVTEE